MKCGPDRGKPAESANKESYCIEPLAPGPFPLKEKAEPGRLSSKVQNKLKGRGHYERESNNIISSLCLADKDNGVATGGPSQKGRPHSENSDGYLNARSVKTTAQLSPTETFISASSDIYKKSKKTMRFSRSRRLELTLQHERSRIRYANDSCYLADT